MAGPGRGNQLKRQTGEINRLLGAVDELMQRRVAILHPDELVGDALRHWNVRVYMQALRE